MKKKIKWKVINVEMGGYSIPTYLKKWKLTNVKLDDRLIV